MSTPDDLERRLTDWLDAQAPTREPKGLADAVIARTRPARRMPGWPGMERWLPLTTLTRPTLVPPLRAAWLLLILLLTLALAAGGAIVGSRLLAGPSTGLPATALIPQGDAAVFAYADWIGGVNGQTDGDIHTVRADGTDVRRLTSGPGIDRSPAWSPDGTRIAFQRWQDGVEMLMVMDSGGGNLTALASRDATWDCSIYDWSTAWSPDGASIIFPTRDGCTGGYDLHIVAADGSTPPVKLLAHRLNSVYGTWSPDGRHIAFLGSDASGSSGLYLADASTVEALAGGLGARRIATDLGVNLNQVGFGTELIQPAWSPDGTELAVTAVTKGFYLVEADGVLVVKADGTGQRMLAERAGTARWSPDGRQLAFFRTVPEEEYVNGRPCTVRTSLIDRDGGAERELPELGDGCGFAPLWSPDGTRLARMLVTPQGPGQDPEFHLGFTALDGSGGPVLLGDAWGSWQPVAAPLPAPPSFPAASATP